MTATINSRLSAMASRRFTKQQAKDTGRTLGPVLLALAISPLAAHAQGTVDVSGVTAVFKVCLSTSYCSGDIPLKS